MPKLSVNVDHVATLRQARKAQEPDPVAAAVLVELAGADGVTVHLREDRRHINDRDLRLLRHTVKTHLNMEMAATEEMVSIAREIMPDMVTLVPEKREELTTEGGLDVLQKGKELEAAISTLHSSGILVSLFVDPDLK
ncbi:MAG TPA: pyridoxine 5'-phosphate synthase, partial [Firmicutes bacterium]|nr:pyridoxine 5'-phosphate synthase [Bacillota bacterium]